MTKILRPEIRESLNAFRRRYRALFAVRAACAFLLAAIPAWVVLAVLDWQVLLPEALRCALGTTVYLGSAVIAWRAGFRAVFGARDPREVARLIERERPELREEMIAAIELGDATAVEAEAKDSLYFRDRVQAAVATAVRDLNPGTVLPFGRVAKRVWVLALTAAGAAALVFFGGEHFGAFLARAIFPFMNLARPAEVAIELVEPAPGDRLVPAHEELAVAVELEGAIPAQVVVEIEEKDGDSFRRDLARVSETRFAGEIPVGEGDLRYRVRAGTAASRYFELEVRARPEVTSFLKTYHYPAYAGWEDREVEADHGDLEALAGSDVEVVLGTIDEIVSGKVQIEGPLGETSRVIEVECADGRESRVWIPVNEEHERYSLTLVSKETGFESAAATRFEIRALPDVPPVVAVTLPGEPSVESRPGAAVMLAGEASDDVRLKSAARSFRVNGGPWLEVSLGEIDGRSAALGEDWQLGEASLEAGDIVLTKFVVTDAAGNTGESLPVKIVVVGDAVTPQEEQWFARESRLQKEIESLMKEASKARDTIQKAQSEMQNKRQPASPEAQREIALAREVSERIAEKVERVRESVREAIEEAPGRTEAMEMRAAGEAISEMANRDLAALEEALADPEPRADRKEPRDFASRIQNAASSLNTQLKAFVAEDRAAMLEKRLEDLAGEQEGIARSAKEEAPADQMREGQAIALERSDKAREEFVSLGEEAGSGERKQADRQADELAKAAERARELMEEERLAEAAAEMERQLDRSHKEAGLLHDALAKKADEFREKALRNSSDPSRALADAEDAAADLAREAQRQAESKRAPNATERAKEEAARSALTENLEAAANMMQEKAALNELMPGSDTQAVADQNRLSRALDALAREAAGPGAMDSAEKARAFEEVVELIEEIDRTLAAEALAGETEAGLGEMARAESTPAGNAQAAAERNAADWEGRVEPALEELPKAAANIRASEAVAKAREVETSEEARQLNAEMEERRDADTGEAAASKETAEALRELAGDVGEVREKMGEQVVAARERLAEMAPSLAEMMEGLATQMETRAETNEARAAGMEGEEPAQPGEVKETLAEASAEGAAAEEGFMDLAQAVRQEANNADFSEPAQRDLARAEDTAMEVLRRVAPRTEATLEKAMAKAGEPAGDPTTLESAEAGETGAMEAGPDAEAAAALGALAKQQGEAAAMLERLAAVFENLGAGTESATEMAQGEVEEMSEALGVAEPMNAAYERAETLAGMLDNASSATEAAALMEALEAELARNPAMQAELGDIARAKAAAAKEQLMESDAGERKLAEAVRAQAAADQGAVPMSEAGAKQEAIAGEVAEAGEMLAQAARHEERLGEAESSEMLGEQGEAVKGLAEGELAEAAEALQGGMPGAAKAEAATGAQEAWSSQVAEMVPDAGKTPAGGTPAPGEAGPAGGPAGTEARLLAEALDALDGQMQGTEAAPGMAAGAPQGIAEALAGAVQSQAAAMAAARRSGLVPGQAGPPAAMAQPAMASGSPQESSAAESDGEGIDGPGGGEGLPGVAVFAPGGDWGKLPERVAGQLREGEREEVSPDYRGAVESYYKAIARRAREGK